VAVSDSIIRVPSRRSQWFAATCGRSWVVGGQGDRYGQVCWPAEDSDEDDSGDWFVRLDARGIVVATTDSALRRDPAALRQRLSAVPRGAVLHNWAFARGLRAQQVSRHMYASMGGARRRGHRTKFTVLRSAAENWRTQNISHYDTDNNRRQQLGRYGARSRCGLVLESVVSHSVHAEGKSAHAPPASSAPLAAASLVAG
jgi:hypothetical protein